jgi:signal transduction histidine kinase
VVQELTGVSLSLAAAARKSADADPLLDQASGAIRESVKSLRSLLVDIYPPNLYEEGIESAIDDLLGQVAKRGVATSLTVNLGGTILDQNTAELLYRSAQEALRNVIAHANAGSVRVDVRVSDGLGTVTIDDDGRGFAQQEWQEQADDGHFGLRALSGLIRDAGGHITVRSTTGVGTRVMAEVPLTRTTQKESR